MLIAYSDFEKLPARNDYLPKDRISAIDRQILKAEPLLFLPTYLAEDELIDAKYEKAKYKIILNGILLDGRTISVVIDEIYPYFEVQLQSKDRANARQEVKVIQSLLERDIIAKPKNATMINGKPFKGYQTDYSLFARFYYTKAKARVAAINLLRDKGYITVHDDISNYYRVVCRDYQTTLSAWVTLSNYTISTVSTLKGLVSDNERLNNVSIRLTCNDYHKYTDDLTNELIKDKSISACWDIETCSPNGAMPTPDNPTHSIICIAVTCQFISAKEPLVQVCFTEFPSEPRPNTYTVVCGCERNIIIAFARFIERMRPQYIFGFNDADYDWPWLIKRASQTKGLLIKLANCFSSSIQKSWQQHTDESIIKYHFYKQDIKLEAGKNATAQALSMFGYIPADVRTIFRKLHPTDEASSLKHFLEKNKLSGKEHMPIPTMFKICNDFRALSKHKNVVWDVTGASLEFKFINIDYEHNQQHSQEHNKHHDQQHDQEHNQQHSQEHDQLHDQEHNQQHSQEHGQEHDQLHDQQHDQEHNKHHDQQHDQEHNKHHDQEHNKHHDQQHGQLHEPNIKQQYQILKDSFANVNYYCIVDAKRCHDLMYIRAVVLDHREVADLTYCSMFDAFYRADGMKVRNTTIGIGQGPPFNIRFSNITNKSFIDGKYPGAFVVPPKKGLQTSKLSFPERIQKATQTANSKHPKYQQWLTDEKTTEQTIVLGHKIIKEYGISLTDSQIQLVEQQYGKLPLALKEFFTERTGRPIGGLDFSSLYPSIVRAYNLSPEYCIYDKSLADSFIANGQRLTETNVNFNGRIHTAWFIWHNNQYATHLDMPDGKSVVNEKFQFGVYPYILNDLFNRRKILKKQLMVLNDRKEKFNHAEQQYKDTHSAADYKLYVEQLANEYEDIIFQIKYIDCKQNAVKRFMNTFYGESGNKLSPFFILELAGGITSYGVKTLQLAYKTVTDASCKVYYGDTDSLYTSMPDAKFETIDRAYYTGGIDKLTYWTKLVEISFAEVKPLIENINATFRAHSNTDFLTMAYEEFMFPLAFTAKKKYFGIEHKHLINFTPKELFIRGLEVKKRGVSNFLKTSFMEILWKCMSINNIDDLLEIVQDKIDYIYSKKWAFDDFIQTDEYRPNKNNVKVQTFVKRMKERNIIVKENERFKYVVVKRYPYSYDTRGRKKELSIGEKIELVDVALAENAEIDIDHYMAGSVNGQLSRLITYHDMFYVEPRDSTDNELKIAEDAIYKNSCKFIDEYCSKYYAKYNTFGKVYQKIFRTANKLASENISRYDPLVGTLLSANIDISSFEDQFIELVEKHVAKEIVNYGSIYVKSQLVDLSKEQSVAKIKQLFTAYGKILLIRTKQYNETLTILRNRIREHIGAISKLYAIYGKSIKYIVNSVKSHIGIETNDELPTAEPSDYTIDTIDTSDINISVDSDIFNSENESKLTVFRTIYLDVYSCIIGMRRTENIYHILKLRHMHINAITIAPPVETMRQSIANDIAASVKNTIGF